jgi:hypothetical protein
MALTRAAFDGVRGLRAFNARFVCDLLYREEFLGDDVAGAWPALTTVRIKGSWGAM